MAEQPQEIKKEIEKHETRKFRYSNEVTFEFDIEVSNSKTAIAEITDFLDLMERVKEDLEGLRDRFQKTLEPKDKKKV